MQDYGHRVRLATHSNFKDFVLTAGLEFYPLGGDPKVLAGCMYLNVSVTFILETHTHTRVYVCICVWSKCIHVFKYIWGCEPLLIISKSNYCFYHVEIKENYSNFFLVKSQVSRSWLICPLERVFLFPVCRLAFLIRIHSCSLSYFIYENYAQ